MDDEILVQEFGLYTPQYDFASALDYKEELSKIAVQKISSKRRRLFLVIEWTVNNSKTKGKMNACQKLLLRAFNTECDDLINRVKYNNYDATLDRIYKSETITKLEIMNISISQKYLDAKIKELRLAFEYREKQQEKKEKFETEQRTGWLQRAIENSERKLKNDSLSDCL
ncbi:MAG: DUF4041 domain-containing protein [Clostridium sp.]